MGGRLDNFTDAAFAFAVTLLIIGGGTSLTTSDALVTALGDLPAFAFGFAIIAMFWIAHVRWRAMRGEGDWIGVALSLLLVFLIILIYVQPLRAMAAATSEWFTGQGSGFRGDVSTLFTIYGTGFVAMSATTAALFADALRSDLTLQQQAYARGDRTIWLILAVTGLVSIAVSFTRFGALAAMVYATLPFTIGLYAARHDWSGTRQR